MCFSAIICFGQGMTPPLSDHFNGKTFFQPGSHPERLFRHFLKWRFTSRPAKWPRHVALPRQPPPPAPQGGEIVATWLGHATFLVQTRYANVLFDPVFSDRVSPFSWAGPRRVHEVPLALDALPVLDAVCVSHDHYDHFDAASLRALAQQTNATFIAPLRHHDLLADVGARRIVELDWWQSYRLSRGAMITLTPTKHWSNRLGTRRNHRLWGGFWVEFGNSDEGSRDETRSTFVPDVGATSAVSPNMAHALGGMPAHPVRDPQSESRHRCRRLWFVGDSGYDARLLHEIRERLGAPDLALVPIGAYEPRWFMAPMHMNPDEAVRVHRDIGARLSLAMHWGTFQLTDEPREAPLRALEQARADHAVSAEAFRVVCPGESVVV